MTREDFKAKVVPLQLSFYRLARWLMKNDEDAEDVSQEIVLRLWNIRQQLDAYSSLKALGLKMTRNLCLDQLKKKGRNAVDLTYVHHNGHQQDERLIEARDSLNLVQQLIHVLPEQQRLVLQLRSVEELEIEEIAEITEQTANHVRVLLCRARKKLKEDYERYHESRS